MSVLAVTKYLRRKNKERGFLTLVSWLGCLVGWVLALSSGAEEGVGTEVAWSCENIRRGRSGSRGGGEAPVASPFLFLIPVRSLVHRMVPSHPKPGCPFSPSSWKSPHSRVHVLDVLVSGNAAQRTIKNNHHTGPRD